MHRLNQDGIFKEREHVPLKYLVFCPGKEFRGDGNWRCCLFCTLLRTGIVSLVRSIYHRIIRPRPGDGGRGVEVRRCLEHTNHIHTHPNLSISQFKSSTSSIFKRAMTARSRFLSTSKTQRLAQLLEQHPNRCHAMPCYTRALHLNFPNTSEQARSLFNLLRMFYAVPGNSFGQHFSFGQSF